MSKYFFNKIDESIMQKPEVSIIMTVFNGEKTLERCIKSVLNQTYKKFEFIIINNYSRDNTLNILRESANKDARIKTIENEKNTGVAESLNKGIRIAKGKYIARIDADDWWENNKLELQMEFFRSNPSFGLIGTNVIEHNEMTNEIKRRKKPNNDKDIKKEILKKVPFVHSSIIVKKSLLDKYGIYDEQIYYAEDYELYCRLMKYTNFFNIQDYLCHRITYGEDSVSLNKWKNMYTDRIRIQLKYYKKYELPLITYFNLVPNLFKLIFPKRTKIIKQRILSILKKL